MSYTVKQVSDLSGVSVRTLHFYDETGLLKPAYVGSNGYRYYEEPQLLTLQQILFYRELGLELKEIQLVIGRPDFDKIPALQSHREILCKALGRTRSLIALIDKTIQHLKGEKHMNTEEMFVGFTVAAGDDRFGQPVTLGGLSGEPLPIDCKVSSKDTGGAMCAFEFGYLSSGPQHSHDDQDEWVYILEGTYEFRVGGKQFDAGPGASIFIPRKVDHVWAWRNGGPGRILNVYQPAGRIEEFWREVAKYDGKTPPFHEVLGLKGMHQFFQQFGMDLSGPPLGWDEYLAKQAKA